MGGAIALAGTAKPARPFDHGVNPEWAHSRVGEHAHNLAPLAASRSARGGEAAVSAKPGVGTVAVTYVAKTLTVCDNWVLWHTR